MLLVLGAALGAENGRARTPPQGWRDWNQFQGDITQADMETAFRGLVSTDFGSIDGRKASLASAGYTDAGLDDVWQLCGSYGPEKYTYHDAQGHPVVDSTKSGPHLQPPATRPPRSALPPELTPISCHVRTSQVPRFQRDERRRALAQPHLRVVRQ